MSYNLFLDDFRYPWVSERYREYYGKDLHGDDYIDMVSAYNYTKWKPFKDKEWDVVRTYDEFCKYITQNGVPELVAFDHDLGDEHYGAEFDKDAKSKVINYEDFTEKTGYDCAKWLCDYCKKHNEKFPEYYIHSMSVPGKMNINYYIKNYKKDNE